MQCLVSTPRTYQCVDLRHQYRLALELGWHVRFLSLQFRLPAMDAGHLLPFLQCGRSSCKENTKRSSPSRSSDSWKQDFRYIFFLKNEDSQINVKNSSSATTRSN